MRAHGVEAGRQHLWDFDFSPENKLATTNAGPPIKKNGKSPKNANGVKKGGHGSQAVDEEDADAPELGELADMVWWEYGLGPQVTEEELALATSGGRGGGQQVPEDEDDDSDDGQESNDEHEPEHEPGRQSVQASLKAIFFTPTPGQSVVARIVHVILRNVVSIKPMLPCCRRTFLIIVFAAC